MNNKIKIFFLSLFILLLNVNTYAQSTMFQDLSYPYLEKLIATAKKNYPIFIVRKERQMQIHRSFLTVCSL